MEPVGAARIDRLVDANRDLLRSPHGPRVAEAVRARLLHPSFAHLPVRVSKRLPAVLRCWLLAKRWAWRLVLIYLVYAAASAAGGFYLEKQLELWQKSDAYTDLTLTVNFLVRKLAVWSGLPKMDSVQELAAGECVLGNPMYRKPLFCCGCKFDITLSKVNDIDKTIANFDKMTTSGKARSFLIVNHDQDAVSYESVRKVSLTHEADMDIGYNQFMTLSGPRVSGLRHLFAGAREPPIASAVLWRFGHVEGLRHFRQLVNRPEFVSYDLEINLPRQFLFIGAGHTDQVSLGSLSELEGQVYIVGLAGEIVFTLQSNPQCCKKPGNRVTRAVKVTPGRLLSLPSFCYEVSARRHGAEYAMAYMGSVAMSVHPGAERVVA